MTASSITGTGPGSAEPTPRVLNQADKLLSILRSQSNLIGIKLNDLIDVDANNPSNNNIVAWNSTTEAWESTSPNNVIDTPGTIQVGNIALGGIRANDEGTVVGNTRGNNSVDLQTRKSTATQVASGNLSIISGGRNNTASAIYSVVVGGRNNTASAVSCFIGGGASNTASGYYSSVLGGAVNTASGNNSFIGGGSSNTASAQYSAILSGNSNAASGNSSVVVGGDNNNATGIRSFVGVGSFNTASGDYSLLLGGTSNNATGTNSTIVSGTNNTASGQNSFIGGGTVNQANGQNSVVGGGSGNQANGSRSAILGGSGNTASGQHAIALGRSAIANKYGQIAKSNGEFLAAGDNQASEYILRNTSTNATPVELFLDGSTERMVLNDNSTWAFEVFVVGRRTNATGESATYQIIGCIDRNAGVATTALVGIPVKQSIEDTAAWDANVSADTTNGALVVTCTGEVSKTIRWTAFVKTTEVSN